MPQPSEAAAFLAFTGDTQFNLDCRKRAKRRGMRLNEFGLWRPKFQDTPPKPTDINDKVDSDNTEGQQSGPNFSQDDRAQWELVDTPDEAALLQELDMGYIIPERRNLANLNTKEKVKRAEGTHSRRSMRD
jgi:DNA polymerase beta thumb